MVALTASALIESYFTVNSEEFPDFDADVEANLIDPFCVVDPGIFIFNLNVNYARRATRLTRVQTMLLIDDVVVASSTVNDREPPSNVALFYEGSLGGDSTVEVKVMAERSFFVEEQQL